jgi:hypothetical protein
VLTKARATPASWWREPLGDDQVDWNQERPAVDDGRFVRVIGEALDKACAMPGFCRNMGFALQGKMLKCVA